MTGLLFECENASRGEIYFFEAYSRSAAAMPAMM